MSSTLGLSDPTSSNANDKPSPTRAGVSPFKRVSAALISGVVPGMGQLLLGKVRAGVWFLAGFVAALSLFWPLRLPQWRLGLSLGAIILGALSITAAWHAARCGHEKSAKLSRWWLLLIVPIAYLAANIDANRALRIA